ncbi:MAG: hypothetical protein HGB02_08635 [Chlorobiaceae bacterium]|nr:hypothetical protein [Chlorobiaceae bacterium]
MLSALHTELIAYLAGKLTGVTVKAFSPEIMTERSVSLPACLIELVDITPFSEFGNRRDRSQVYLNFEARLLVDPILENGYVELKEFAAMAWWALRDWAPQSPNVGPINLKRAGDDAFKPGLDGYLVWLVEWEHEAWLNFADDEVLPLVRKLTVTDQYDDTSEAETTLPEPEPEEEP